MSVRSSFISTALTDRQLLSSVGGWVLSKNYDATAQEIQIAQKYKRKQPFMPGVYRQPDTCDTVTNTHQVIVRPPILTTLKILSLRGCNEGTLKGEVKQGDSLTSIRPSTRFLMSMGFGWNRGMSCRVTSLIRSLWAMCFLSFMILTIHACEPPVRSSLIQGAGTLPLSGVFVPHRSCHASPSVLRSSRLSTRLCLS